MELLHIIYHKSGAKDQSMLLLHIGNDDNKVIGLSTEYLSDAEIMRLKKLSRRLDNMNTGALVKWLQQHIKEYNKAFRSIYDKNYTVVQRYELKT